jgi:hypothetical protein
MAVAASLPLWLPAATAARIHCLALGALAVPWLVLGRDAARRREGLRDALRIAPRAGRLVLAELAPGLLVIATAVGVTLFRTPAAAFALFAWGALLLCAADALDRRAPTAGAAWAALWIGAIAWLALPLWAARWFGAQALAPWPSTLAVGLHPTAAALAGAHLPTLQDRWFYSLTLSGVIETRPLPWFYGAGTLALAALLAAALAVRGARIPERRVS